MRRAITALLIIAAVGAAGGAYYMRRGGPEITVNTSPVTRGDIVDTVGATGTLQAVTTVQVGSQVSGNISELGADFNSIVKKGQVIARLDPSLFDAQLQQAKANLTQARANLAKAQSELERNKVQLVDAQQKYTRAKELAAKSLIPQSDLDAAKIALDAAQAGVQSQQATVAQSQAQVTQSDATVNQNQVNLDHTIITAPIDGIVIQRSVDVGQTVAASMQAPTLFIIAADLTKMQVNANIDESDVGRIRPNQTVTFRVDAYPGEQFIGTVEQIRLQPVVVQNVTTYGTIINVPNQDLRLKPGMTANLRVQIAKRDNALRVPNAALRFRPTNDIFAALNQTPPPEAQFGGRGRRGRGGAGNGNDAEGALPAAPTAASGDQTPGAPGQSAAKTDKPTQAPGAGQAAAPAASEAGGRRGSGGDRGDAGSNNGNFGGGRGFSGGGSGGGANGGDRGARMLERFKTMSPDEQKQFLARLKERGADTSALEAAMKPAASAAKPAAGKNSSIQSAQTIDALFAPLPVVETRGRAWLYMNKELKQVNLRLGITDGTNTELVSGELQPGMEVVTGVVTSASTRTSPAAAGGNPLLGNQGRGPGGFGGPPGGGRGR
jgi:HlyD family secretion protein